QTDWAALTGSDRLGVAAVEVGLDDRARRTHRGWEGGPVQMIAFDRDSERAALTDGDRLGIAAVEVGLDDRAAAGRAGVVVGPIQVGGDGALGTGEQVPSGRTRLLSRRCQRRVDRPPARGGELHHDRAGLSWPETSARVTRDGKGR